MAKGNLTNEQVQELLELYKNKKESTHSLAEKFKVGHKKISKLLKDNNIEINKRGGQVKDGLTDIITKAKVMTYDEDVYIAKCKRTGTILNDPNNYSGTLTLHIIKTFGNVPIPTNIHQRKKYELIYGKKWFEEYFDIIPKNTEKKETRKCGLCEWVTEDISNKTGCFEVHLTKTHEISLDDYLDIFPNELKFHLNFIKNIEREKFLTNIENHVVCMFCKQKMKIITNTHLLQKHNITPLEYKIKFPNNRFVSQTSSKIISNNSIISNANMEPNFKSGAENDIKEFIESLGFDVMKSKNRNLLKGKEIDIVIPKLKIGIEYNGIYWHTEGNGKNQSYHLDKTIACNNIGYKLIHIFEDEWIIKNILVKHKIKHILGINNGIRIGGRNVKVVQISSEIKSLFLDEFHIQGNDKSDIFYGAYFNAELVGVMTFSFKRNMTKNVDGQYELKRYAVNYKFIISGLASKFIKNFIIDYNPKSIISFADRRWTLDANENLYTKLGFKLTNITRPNYWYYNSKINKYKRFHKFGFGKSSLKRDYPELDMTKTERELTLELGYDRIWDCGLFKYEMNLK